jgi:hypothetical protein
MLNHDHILLGHLLILIQHHHTQLARQRILLNMHRINQKRKSHFLVVLARSLVEF